MPHYYNIQQVLSTRRLVQYEEDRHNTDNQPCHRCNCHKLALIFTAFYTICWPCLLKFNDLIHVRRQSLVPHCKSSGHLSNLGEPRNTADEVFSNCDKFAFSIDASVQAPNFLHSTGPEPRLQETQ
jgi:hypothetical protein